MAMEARLVDEKMRGIEQLLNASTRTVPESARSGFAAAIKSLRGWDCFRINPIAFAENHGLDLDETIGLFIYGAKAGLFTFEWNLLCPLCGGREHSYHSLNQLDRESYHCTLCDIDVEVEADSHLEVSFSLPRSVGGPIPDPYRSLDEYRSFFFSPNIVWTPEIDEAFASQPPLRFVAIPAGKKARIPIGVPPSKRHRFVTLDTHSIFTVAMDGSAKSAPGDIAVVLTDSGFDRHTATIPPEPGRVVIANNTDRTKGCIIGSPDSEYLQTVIPVYPPYFKPFLTGKMMLNNQTFRDLFLVDNLPDDLSLKINDITLLFTDLKGSTELYDRTGDIHAYRLVQKHFKILQSIVHVHHGGIVKTMGDAIMASFNIPLDGVRAAFSMLEKIEDFNESIPEMEDAIGLKIGLHRGTVIAVKANQTLDYFGQTVNIAARVQGLAGSGEIWMTEDIMKDDPSSNYLRDAGYPAVPRDVALKGVGSLVRVHSCCR